MKKFQTRFARNLAKQEVITNVLFARFVTGDKIINRTNSARVKKKHQHLFNAMNEIHMLSQARILNLHVDLLTDAELIAKLWRIQQQTLRDARTRRVSIPDCTGVMGRYRYALEHYTVREVRRVMAGQ